MPYKDKAKQKEQRHKYYLKNKEGIRREQKLYYLENKDKILKQHKEYYNNNKEKYSENQKIYYLNNRKKLIKDARKYKLKHKFGITLEQYNEMFEKQNGYCAICGRHQSEFKRKLAVDHCHETGKVRKLLCTKCNFVLGWIEKYKINFNNYLERE